MRFSSLLLFVLLINFSCSLLLPEGKVHRGGKGGRRATHLSAKKQEPKQKGQAQGLRERPPDLHIGISVPGLPISLRAWPSYELKTHLVRGPSVALALSFHLLSNHMTPSSSQIPCLAALKAAS